MPPPSDSKEHQNAAERRRVGLWLIGARGAISTTVAYGLAGMREGLVEPRGLVTETAPLDQLDTIPLANFVLGGHEVRRGDLTRSAGDLVRQRILSESVLAASAGDAAAFDGRIRPGLLDGPDVGVADLEPRSSELGAANPRDQIAAVQADLAAFATSEELDDIVVVNLSSTEAQRDRRPEWASLEAFESAMDAGEPQPASLLYAYAAMSAGYPHVNFTPNLGASVPALRELSLREGVPHCGQDGKTGETLVKTALAPMFTARALRVLTWQGYNMLGNRDGEVLSDPVHKESKLHNKDDALRSVLGDPDVHTRVGIDYVPSLGDWKTAWDFIHFEGFLGTRMSLQFTWQGSDSALAAPLVLDLARLAELAHRRGEAGSMDHCAAFFKAPLGGGSHDFHDQVRRLHEYARAGNGA